MTDLEQLLATFDSFGLKGMELKGLWQLTDEPPGIDYFIYQESGAVEILMGMGAGGFGGATTFSFTSTGDYLSHRGVSSGL